MLSDKTALQIRMTFRKMTSGFQLNVLVAFVRSYVDSFLNGVIVRNYRVACVVAMILKALFSFDDEVEHQVSFQKALSTKNPYDGA